MDRGAQSHEHFSKRFIASEPSMHVAANVLTGIGLENVTILPMRLTPDYESRYAYTDNGDLTFSAKVSVKHHPRLSFTGPDDYPWRYVLIDEVYKLDPRNDIGWWGSIQLDDDKSHAYIVTRASYTHWFKKTAIDSVLNEKRTWWAAPLRVVRFVCVSTACPAPPSPAPAG